MKILFDQLGKPISPVAIKNAVDYFGASYTDTIQNVQTNHEIGYSG